MPLSGVVAVALALWLDASVGEPPRRVHPVAWFGRLVDPLDRQWTRPGPVGVAGAIALPAIAAATAGGAASIAWQVSPVAGTAVAALVLFSTTSLGMLVDEARGVVAASETDLDGARERLPALVGRDPSDLSAGQVRSAAVESAAENLADGLVAPLLAFAVLASASVPLATAGAAWVKAVNTLDSMLGYPSKPVGRASARLDDAVMWFPARLSAILLALVARDPGSLFRTTEQSKVPSPNAGWPMGTLAAVLGVRLEKPGVYVLDGDAPLPTAGDAHRGIEVVRNAGMLAFLGAGVIAWS